MTNTNLNKEGKRLNNPLRLRHLGLYRFGIIPIGTARKYSPKRMYSHGKE